MEAGEVVRLPERLEGDGLRIWLDGSWGVDALLERHTRDHDDLDLLCELADSDGVVAVFEGAGYELVAGEAPLSSVLVDAKGRTSGRRSSGRVRRVARRRGLPDGRGPRVGVSGCGL
jgi:hypothetical protein